MLKHKNSLVRSGLLSLLMISTLVSCGGSSDTGNENKPSDDKSSVDVVPDNSRRIKNLDQLADDLTLDEEGKVTFEDQVELKVWCIIGDPDQTVYNSLVTKFNEEYSGLIHLNMTYIGHYDFYNNLNNTYTTDKDSMPDVLVMHNERPLNMLTLAIFFLLMRLRRRPQSRPTILASIPISTALRSSLVLDMLFRWMHMDLSPLSVRISSRRMN